MKFPSCYLTKKKIHGTKKDIFHSRKFHFVNSVMHFNHWTIYYPYLRPKFDFTSKDQMVWYLKGDWSNRHPPLSSGKYSPAKHAMQHREWSCLWCRFLPVPVGRYVFCELNIKLSVNFQNSCLQCTTDASLLAQCIYHHFAINHMFYPLHVDVVVF